MLPEGDMMQAALSFSDRLMPIGSETISELGRRKEPLAQFSFSNRFINPFNLLHIQSVNKKKKGVKQDAEQEIQRKEGCTDEKNE